MRETDLGSCGDSGQAPRRERSGDLYLEEVVRIVQPNDARRLKQLEQENARLKNLGAERNQIEVMKEIAAGKCGRAGPSPAGGARWAPLPIVTAVLHADGRAPFGLGLPVEEGEEGCASAGAHAGAGYPIPAFQLSANVHRPWNAIGIP